MIISRGRRFIFVHIPKTGGTALAQALEAHALADDLLIGDTPKARRRKRRLAGVQTRGRLWKHSRLGDIDGLVTPTEITGFFNFTLVRNPWDRVVSYYHWLQCQSFAHPAVELARSHDFSDFLNAPHTQATLGADSYGHYMRDATGVERCSAFVRLEHLDRDLAPVRAHLGLRLDDIPRRNASPRRRDYRSYYSTADAERVAILAAEDIARFGYRFE